MNDASIVSVICPVRNEELHIGSMLQTIASQELPPSVSLEVIVVDGDSTDGTVDVVRRFGEDHPTLELRLLHNPRRTVPYSLNAGLATARGRVVIRIDGHCSVPPGYITRCLQLLEETGADCVGGRVAAEGTTPWGRAIAAAQSSRFGVGGVAFRSADAEPGEVDTLAFGAYRREVFERIGTFDVELTRNQDEEFNYRLRAGGGRIWLDPSLVFRYHNRSTLRGLWRQYLEYGKYKVLVYRKLRSVPRLRHAAPLALVAGLSTSGAVGILSDRPWTGPAIAGAYVSGVVLAATGSAGRLDSDALRTAAAAICMHLAYGVGTAWGIVAFGFRGTPTGPHSGHQRATSRPNS